MHKYLGIIMLVLCVGTAAAQEDSQYYGPGMLANWTPVGDSAGDLTINAYKTSDRDLHTRVDGMVYDVAYSYDFGRKGAANSGDIVARYATGDVAMKPFGVAIDASLDYKLDIGGSWLFERDFGFMASIGAGKMSVDDMDARIDDFAVGIKFMQDQMEAGLLLDYGSFDDPAGDEVKYKGIELTGMEMGDTSWLKWYIGEADGKGFVKTDLSFPLSVESQGEAYAIMVRWINVNSHIKSVGASQMASYGIRPGDWTDHVEWWITVVYGLNRRVTDWSVIVSYGLYRTNEFSGNNDSKVIQLGIKYYF